MVQGETNMEHHEEASYGAEIPDEEDIDGDVDMSRTEKEEHDSKEMEKEAGDPKILKEIPADAANGPKNIYKDPDDGRQRFLLELEFVQCLANPTYIHYLAQNRYFEDESFIGYLKYLQYWQRPEYVKFIMYPHCLYFLELLQSANFRSAIAHPGNKELAHRQQFYFWKNYRNNRLKHILPRPLPEPQAAAAAAAAASASLSAPPVPVSTPVPASGTALSPMQYSNIPPKNDQRNTAIRKRKKDT